MNTPACNFNSLKRLREAAVYTQAHDMGFYMLAMWKATNEWAGEVFVNGASLQYVFGDTRADLMDNARIVINLDIADREDVMDRYFVDTSNGRARVLDRLHFDPLDNYEEVARCDMRYQAEKVCDALNHYHRTVPFGTQVSDAVKHFPTEVE